MEKAIWDQLPGGAQYLTRIDANIVVDGAAMLAAREAELVRALDAGDWQAVLAFCPIRESRALEAISQALRFKNRDDFQKAVLNLLSKDAKTLGFVRSLFAGLHARLEENPA